MAFNAFSETLNSLITKVGTFAQEFIDNFWNFIDNNYMSMDKNFGSPQNPEINPSTSQEVVQSASRFTEHHLSQPISADVPVGADILIFVPLALILATFNLAVNVWYSYLNRDAWDAYWEKEEQKLGRIKQSLDKQTSPTQSSSNNFHDDRLIPLKTMGKTIALDPEEDVTIRKNLSPRKKKLLKEIAGRLKGYQKNTQIFRKEIDAYKQKSPEKADEIAPLDDTLTRLMSTLDSPNSWSNELNAIWEKAPIIEVGKKASTDHLAVIAKPKSNIQNNFENQRILLAVDPEQELLVPKSTVEESEATLSIGQKIKNSLLSFLKNFSDDPVFYTAFSYAWTYWFVFFFTVWGLPEYSSFTSVPIEFSLFALIGSIIYLSYKEYIAYKNFLNVELSPEEKSILEKRVEEAKQKKLEELNKSESLLLISQLSAEQIQLLRLEVLKEILYEHARNNNKFRQGWWLVALIAGLAIGASCGLPVVGAVFVGIGVFVAILLVVKGVTHLIDSRAAAKRAEMLQEAEIEASKKIPIPAVSLETDLDIVNDTTLEVENQSTFDNSTRKTWAASRKDTLKEVEYLVACLKQQEQLEEIAHNLNIDLTQSESSNRSSELKLEQRNSLKAKMEDEHNSLFFWAKVYQWVATVLDFTSSYMFVAAMIGFVALDILGNVFNVTLLAVSAPFSVPVIVCTVIVASLALLAATSSGYRTWSKHQEQNEAFKKQILSSEETANKQIEDYQNSKIDLLYKTQLVKNLRNQLKNKLKTNKTQFSDHFDILNQLLDKPVKERSWTLRKFVKGLRKVVYVITSISSVALISRAICTMGFAALVPALATGSLVVFGAVTNPLGIAVLSIAAVLLLLRVAREFYLAAKQAKAMEKANHIAWKLEKKENELVHLEKVKHLIDTVAPHDRHGEDILLKRSTGTLREYNRNHAPVDVTYGTFVAPGYRQHLNVRNLNDNTGSPSADKYANDPCILFNNS